MFKIERYWEIDVIRAVGLVLMIVQHSVIVWNAITLGKADAPEIIDGVGQVGGLIFVTLVGVSAYLSYSARAGKVSEDVLFRHFLWRGLSLLGWGLVINLATGIVVPSGPVYFGVLHFIGSTVVIAPFLIKFPWLRRMLFIGAPALALIGSQIDVSTFNYLALGVFPTGFDTLDYWPLFPWLAVPCVGIELGKVLYPNGKRTFKVPMPQSIMVPALTWIGSHTLLLYLVHVPVLFLLLSMVYYLVD